MATKQLKDILHCVCMYDVCMYDDTNERKQVYWIVNVSILNKAFTKLDYVLFELQFPNIFNLSII